MAGRLPTPEDICARLVAFTKGPLARSLAVVSAVRWGEIYLVGGCVRDLLLGMEDPPDLDFLTPQGAFELARAVAAALGGSFVALDEVRGIARVVVRRDGRLESMDFSNYQRPTLVADLCARDLTINAMAVDISPLVDQGADHLPELIDPAGGRHDLCRGIVRCPAVSVLDDDPLRLLRAVRFACVLGFTLDAVTRDAIATRADSIRSVAGERVRDEVFKILASRSGFEGITLLEAVGLLGVIFPELNDMRGLAQGSFHHLDVFEHTMRAVQMIEEKAIPLARSSQDWAPLQRHLGQKMGRAEHRRRECLQLAALLHDVGKPRARHFNQDGCVSYKRHEEIGASMVRDIAERLRLSRAECMLVTSIVRWHLEPLEMQATRPSEIRQYFKRVGMGGVETIIMALADSEASCGPSNTPQLRAALAERALRMLRWFFSDAPAGCVPLLDGTDIASLLGLQPGKEIGLLLENLADAQADGQVTTCEEARNWVSRSGRSLISTDPAR